MPADPDANRPGAVPTSDLSGATGASRATVLTVGVLGWGALGSAIGHRLAQGAVPGAELTGVAVRSTPPSTPPAPVIGADRIGTECNLVIEAAGHEAVGAYGEDILRAGARLLVLSTGALGDPELLGRLSRVGQGRLLFGTGAIGGVDLIGACRHMGPISSITLETTKPSAILAQPWMPEAMVAELDAGTTKVDCFHGPAVEAADRFPSSVNVAATLALAAGGWDVVSVRVVGDPAATGNRHHITIEAEAGRYEVDVANAALADNPRSSALVVGSTLRAVESLVATIPRPV